jgi:hypothetical protein
VATVFFAGVDGDPELAAAAVVDLSSDIDLSIDG